MAPRILSDEEFNALPADRQAQVVSELEASQLPSNQPILMDLANLVTPGMGISGGPELNPEGSLPGLIHQGLDYYHSNINPKVQGVIGGARNALGGDSGESGFDNFLGNAASNALAIPGIMSEMIQSPTRGDVARGVGAAGGAALGAPGGIPGMMAGGAIGQNLTDDAVRLVDGTMGQKTWTDTAVQMGGGALSGLMGKSPTRDPVRMELQSQINATNYKEGLKKLVSLLVPTAKDSTGIFNSEAHSLVNSLDELINKFNFKIDSPESISEHFFDKLGGKLKDGTIKHGTLRTSLNASARALDEVVPAKKLSESIIGGTPEAPITIPSLSGKFQGFLAEVEDDLVAMKPKEKQAILTDLSERIKGVEGSFVNKELSNSRTLERGVLDKLNENIASIDADLASKGLSDAKRGKLISRKKDLELKSFESSSKINELDAQIANPEVSFTKLINARDTIDEVVKKEFGKESSTLKGKIKDLAELLRTHEDELAGTYSQQGLIAPEVAGDYLSLKREYHLLKEVEPDFGKLLQEAAKDPGKASWQWKPLQAYARVDSGGIKSNLYGGLLPTRNSPGEATLRKELRNLDTIIQSQGKQMPGLNIANTARSSLNSLVSQASQANAVRNIPLVIAGRSLDSYIKNPASIEDLKQSLFISSLKNLGAPVSEQGADLSQIPPETIQQAHMEAQQMSQMLTDALTMGDEEDQGIALTKLAKISPDSFAPPKSGIKGEITIGGQRKLYDPMDRIKYTEKLKTNSDLSNSEKARKISQLNDNYTIN